MFHNILEPMGFDPNRPLQRKPTDVYFVVFGLVVMLALIAWAFLG